MFRDTVKLGFGHNLVRADIPGVIGIEKFSKIIEKASSADLASLGLFESSSPNYTTYYPDVKAEDLVPAESDFIEPAFRALSEVIVHKNWNPIDFAKPGVLKASTGLLLGQSIYVDHETMTGNAIGAVSRSVWQEKYSANNIQVPAGILANLKIDGKSNPRIARGVNMDPPSVHSTSVTVEFLYEKSHEVADEEFWRKLGSFDKDGNMYRRVATKVIKYNEISLVGHGADPFAQKTGPDGKIINPKYAGISNNSEKAVEVRKEQKFFFMDFKDLVSNSEQETIPLSVNDNDGEDKNNTKLSTMNFLVALCKHLGITTDGQTQEQLEAQLTALLPSLGNTTALTASVTALTNDKTRLEAEVADLKAKQPTEEVTTLQAFKTARLKETREETIRLYTVLSGDKPAEAILTVLKAETTPFETLAALGLQYKTQLEKDMPITCKSCGSTEVNRASAVNQEAGNKGSNNSEPKSNQEVAKNILNKRKKSLNIHGLDEQESK